MPPKETLEKHNPSINPLSAFAWFPRQVNFETQETQEKVVLLLRRHWITNLGWVLLTIIFIFLPVVVFSLGRFVMPQGTVLTLANKLVAEAVLIWYLLVFGYAFTQFINWYFNVFIVTDRRLIDVDFLNILHKRISEAELQKVQDITHQTVGAAALLFDYGDVYIQTAAELTDLDFEKVPHPSEVHKIIGELLKNLKNSRHV